jgi:hypothetical protein
MADSSAGSAWTVCSAFPSEARREARPRAVARLTTDEISANKNGADSDSPTSSGNGWPSEARASEDVGPDRRSSRVIFDLVTSATVRTASNSPFGTCFGAWPRSCTPRARIAHVVACGVDGGAASV